MNLPQNNWNAIRAHYAYWAPRILAGPRNEWVGGAYAWDDGSRMIIMTPIESWFWADIRACDAVLYPQYPVFNFFLDFANPVAKVAIECDGAAYHQDKAKDAARDRRLADAGWSVYRISGASCRLECDAETGAPSIPMLFMQQICERHEIARHPWWLATGEEDEIDRRPNAGFTTSEESITRWWERAQREREERRCDR